MKNKNTVISIVAGVVVVAGVAAFLIFGGNIPTPGTANADAVATVNGEEIESAEFEARVAQAEQLLASQGQAFALQDETMRAQFETQVLDQMIAEKLFRQEAEDQGITVTDEEVNNQLSTLSMQLGGEEMLTDQLAAVGISQSDFRQNVENQILIQKYIDANIDSEGVAVTEEEITTLYNQVSAGQEGVPPLEEIRDQIEFEIIQQKEGEQIAALAQQLRTEADVEITL